VEAFPVGIGSILIERGLIDSSQLDEAIEEQKRTGERLDRVMVRMGLIRDDEVLEAIGTHFEMPIIDLEGVEVEEETLRLLPSKLVFKQRCVPIGRGDGVLRIATSDPFELSAFDELRLLTGLGIELVLADERDLTKFIRSHYGVAGDTLEALATDESKTIEVDSPENATEIELAQEASVVKLVNDLLLEAIRERATDVHIEPFEDELEVRYRIDGVLGTAGVPQTINRFRNAIVSRLKIMANLNIAEKRLPQDGRISLRHRSHEYDLRLSVIPMLHGEGVVLRILDQSSVLLGLEQLGMPSNTLERWDDLIARPHGILLVTGPTGSGKSTTLYASLSRIVSKSVKAITVEDPVEYQVEGVNQIQVNNSVGLSFAEGLRSILRHDPDIIMIGEIRDQETANAAVQASLTGHLVFSTLHTNDAASAPTRLLDMGVEPFLVASAVEGVLAQRLLRKVCPECAKPIDIDTQKLPADFELPNSRTLVEGVGCRECRRSGYQGRMGAFELLRFTPMTREMIMQRVPTGQLVEAACAEHELNLIRGEAFALVRDHKTTLAEAMRICRA
jgi:general secretion pathway protein E/type IV pilus assembly protein PilB